MTEFQIIWAVGEDQCLALFLEQSYNEWTLAACKYIGTDNFRSKTSEK